MTGRFTRFLATACVYLFLGAVVLWIVVILVGLVLNGVPRHTATMPHGRVLPASQAFSGPEWTPAPLAFSRGAGGGASTRPAAASDPSELSPVLTSVTW